MPEIIDSYGDVKIVKERGAPFPLYMVHIPQFTEEERSIVERPKALVSNYREIMNQVELISSPGEKDAFLKKYLKGELEGRRIRPENMERIISIIMDEVFLGYGRLGPVMRDQRLEEIMINSVNLPIFVIHREHGMCMTNIRYETHEVLQELIDFLCRYSGREINEDTPLLDAHMPDGSRANVAIAPAAPRGPAITIRKFRRIPYNVIDLIGLGTLSIDLTAFLWTCIEGLGLHPSNMLIAGGSGSGKTTMFNALAMFIPKTDRVITAEDTLELNLEFLENWVALEANPSVLGKSKLSLEAIVENALRMRPDRVMIGEVRGREAQTLFVAMDIGLDGSMCTVHANTARDTTLRLMDEPMNVQLRTLPLVDLIVVLNRYFDRKRGVVRRVTEVAEIAGIEGEVVQLGEVYKWNSSKDHISRTEYPIILKDKIADKCGITKKRLNAEIFVREKILEYMLKKGIKDNKGVIEIFQMYYDDPKTLLSKINPKLLKYKVV